MKKLTSIIISLTLVILFTATGYTADHGNTTNDSFNKAKKTLERQVYADHRITFYCNCPFSPDKKILPSENYTPKKEGKRAHRLEWEHIVQLTPLGRAFPNGEMATQTVWTRKVNRLKVGIARGKLLFRSGIWKRTCTTWCRRSER